MGVLRGGELAGGRALCFSQFTEVLVMGSLVREWRLLGAPAQPTFFFFFTVESSETQTDEGLARGGTRAPVLRFPPSCGRHLCGPQPKGSGCGDRSLLHLQASSPWIPGSWQWLFH